MQLTGDDNSSCPARQRLGKPCNSVLTPDPSGAWRPFTDGGDPAVQQKVEQYLVHVYPQPRQGLPAGTERFIGCGRSELPASPNLTCVLWEKRAGRQPLRPLHFLTATTTGFDALRLERWGQVADLQWQQSSIALRTGGILNIPYRPRHQRERHDAAGAAGDLGDARTILAVHPSGHLARAVGALQRRGGAVCDASARRPNPDGLPAGDGPRDSGLPAVLRQL